MKKTCMVFVLNFFFIIKVFAGTAGCEEPVHPVKKLICKDSSFAELYRKVDVAFEKEMSLTKFQLEAEAEQDNWLSQVTSICKDKIVCYTDKFQARLELLVSRRQKSEEDEAKDNKSRVQLVSGFPDKKLLSDAEVILVSGYSSDQSSGIYGVGGSRPRHNISYVGSDNKIIIDRPGSKVLLVLSSFKNIPWRLEATQGTVIVAIVVSGSEVVFSNVKTSLYSLPMPYAYDIDTANFEVIQSVLHKNLGINSIDVFKGNRVIPNEILINTLDKSHEKLDLMGIQPKKSNINFSFELLAPDLSNSRWSLFGPLGASISPSVELKNRVSINKKIYQLHNDKLEIKDEITQAVLTPDLPKNFPKFSWLQDLAYDPVRNIISVVSLGGEGFWYRYSVKDHNWIDFNSLEGIDVSSIFFDKKTNQYVGIGPHSKLVTVSPEGKLLTGIYILDQLPGLLEGSIDQLHLKIVSAEDDVALIDIEGDIIKRIWHYKMSSKKASLTYKLDLDIHCIDILTQIEKFICTDKKIAEMEQSAKELYKILVSKVSYNKYEFIDQKTWQSDTRDKCSDRVCLSDVYQVRLKYLDARLKLVEDDFLNHWLNLSEELPDKNIAVGTEVVVVSGNKPKPFGLDDSNNNHKRKEGSSVRINLDKPGSKIILVLTSYENINWKIDISKDTNLVGVIVSDYNHRSFVLTNKKPILYAGSLSLDYVDSSNSAEFKKLLKLLNQTISVNKIDVFKGYDLIPNDISINKFDKSDESLSLIGKAPSKVPNNLSFDLVTTSQKKVQWFLNGPKTSDSDEKYIEEEFAVGSDRFNRYTLGSSGIEIHNPFVESAQTKILPSNFPALSNPSGIAYDTKRNIVGVINNSGEGYFYRYEPKSEKWIDFHTMSNFDARTIAYDEITDRYVAWGTLIFEQNVLLFISNSGEILFKEALENIIPEFKAIYPSSKIKIIPKGDMIILVALSKEKVTHIWSYNLTTKLGQLTYNLAWNKQ